MPLVYASSAAVYGGGADFREDGRRLAPAQRLWLVEAALRPVARRARASAAARSSASATSTSTGRARRTRGGWRASSTTSTASSATPARSACSAARMASATASTAATSSSSTTSSTVNLWAFDSAERRGHLQCRHRGEPQLQRPRPRRDRLAWRRADRIYPDARRPRRGLPGLHRGRHRAAEARWLCRAFPADRGWGQDAGRSADTKRSIRQQPVQASAYSFDPQSPACSSPRPACRHKCGGGRGPWARSTGSRSGPRHRDR